MCQWVYAPVQDRPVARDCYLAPLQHDSERKPITIKTWTECKLSVCLFFDKQQFIHPPSTLCT